MEDSEPHEPFEYDSEIANEINSIYAEAHLYSSHQSSASDSSGQSSETKFDYSTVCPANIDNRAESADEEKDFSNIRNIVSDVPELCRPAFSSVMSVVNDNTAISNANTIYAFTPHLSCYSALQLAKVLKRCSNLQNIHFRMWYKIPSEVLLSSMSTFPGIKQQGSITLLMSGVEIAELLLRKESKHIHTLKLFVLGKIGADIESILGNELAKSYFACDITLEGIPLNYFGGLLFKKALARRYNFQCVRLHYMQLSSRVFKTLARNSSLLELDLRGVGLNQVLIKSLSKSLESNTTIRVLDVSHNFINKKTMPLLEQGIVKNTSLLRLNISYNYGYDEETNSRFMNYITRNRRLAIEELIKIYSLLINSIKVRQLFYIIIMYCDHTCALEDFANWEENPKFPTTELIPYLIGQKEDKE